MSKNKSFIIAIIIIASVLILAGVCYLIFDNSDKINQGNVRITDMMVQSRVNVDEVQEEAQNTKSISDMVLNLTQSNTISILLTKDVKIKNIYIDEITIKEPSLKGNIGLYLKNEDEAISFSDNMSRISLPYEEYEGQYLVEIGVNNKEFAKSVKIPDGTSSVTFDGTILKLLSLNVSDLKFELKFTLNVVDEFGNTTKCKMTIRAPEEDLSTSGIVVIHEDLNDYIFKKDGK